MAEEEDCDPREFDSCEACECDCEQNDIEDLLYAKPKIKREPIFRTNGEPYGGTDTDIVRRPSALRFVCLSVDENGDLACSAAHGGPTTSNLDLVSMVVAIAGLPPTGTTTYRFRFHGWYKRRVAELPRTGGRFTMVQPADDKFDLDKLVL